MRRAGLALALLLAFPAAASAQTPPEPTLTVSAVDVFGGSRPMALTGRSFTARVVMRPYIAGETVTLRLYRGSRKIKVKSLTLKSVAGGTAGVATLKVKSGKPGRLRLSASHQGTAVLKPLAAKSFRLDAVRPSAGPGTKGPAVRLLQERLAAMHYVVPRSGVYDAGTGRAVMAWRKLAGLSRTTLATKEVFDGVLAGRGTFKVRHPGDGRHVEARLNSQVMALINGSRVERIYHISSGAPATPTVRGKFRVYLKTPGVNAKGMVHSSYFIRGYAIHGYASVPPYNASHGCLRVPVPNARSIYDWLRIGDVVWVEP
jgi:hypothetical protein